MIFKVLRTCCRMIYSCLLFGETEKENLKNIKNYDTHTRIKQCMCQNDNPDSNCVTELFVLRFKILKT